MVLNYPHKWAFSSLVRASDIQDDVKVFRFAVVNLPSTVKLLTNKISILLYVSNYILRVVVSMNKNLWKVTYSR